MSLIPAESKERPAWSTNQDPGQLRPHRKTLSQKAKQKSLLHFTHRSTKLSKENMKVNQVKVAGDLVGTFLKMKLKKYFSTAFTLPHR